MRQKKTNRKAQGAEVMSFLRPTRCGPKPRIINVYINPEDVAIKGSNTLELLSWRVNFN